MSALLIGLIAVAVVIVLVLGAYAARLLMQVKKQNDAKMSARNKRIESMQSSIQTIAFAMQQQQCDFSEGSIRICRLLESLPLNPLPDYAKQFPATHALFDKVKNYPTHEARAALSKSQRRQQDKEREQFESEWESKILDETQALREFDALS
jgi:cell division protein FtsL